MRREFLRHLLERTIFDEKESYRVRTMVTAALLGSIGFFMFIFNIIFWDVFLMSITGTMFLVGAGSFFLAQNDNKYQIARVFISIIYVGGLVAFLYYGSSEGIAPFWAFLLPFMSYFLYGMKYGSMIAGGYLLATMIMLWAPYDFLVAYDYSAGFLKRFPIIYAAAYLAASGTEYIRVLTRRRLDAAVAELEEITMIDTLTGIENRRSFEGRLNETWHIFSGKENYISVLLIDIDYFKYYNDTYGHLKGDEALKQVADSLKKTVSQGHGYVSRWGGEEFICLLPFYDNGQAVSMAKDVLEAVESQGIEHRGSELPGRVLTVSIGVATVNATSGIDPKEVLRGADESLYEAKSYGRNRIGRSRTYG